MIQMSTLRLRSASRFQGTQNFSRQRGPVAVQRWGTAAKRWGTAATHLGWEFLQPEAISTSTNCLSSHWNWRLNFIPTNLQHMRVTGYFQPQQTSSRMGLMFNFLTENLGPTSWNWQKLQVNWASSGSTDINGFLFNGFWCLLLSIHYIINFNMASEHACIS